MRTIYAIVLTHHQDEHPPSAESVEAFVVDGINRHEDVLEPCDSTIEVHLLDTNAADELILS